MPGHSQLREQTFVNLIRLNHKLPYRVTMKTYFQTVEQKEIIIKEMRNKILVLLEAQKSLTEHKICCDIINATATLQVCLYADLFFYVFKLS